MVQYKMHVFVLKKDFISFLSSAEKVPYTPLLFYLIPISLIAQLQEQIDVTSLNGQWQQNKEAPWPLQLHIVYK